jgi:hypothetical protein
MKKIKENLTQIIDRSTGEIINEITVVNGNTYTSEPAFVKLYLQDILYLNSLPLGLMNIMLSILRRMDYNNRIGLFKAVKSDIAKENNLSVSSVNKYITILSDSKLIIRDVLYSERGFYYVNPAYFGKGHWQDIKRLRLQIEYRDNCRVLNSHTFNSEQPLSPSPPLHP